MKMNIKRSSLIMKKKKITTTASFSVIKRVCASSRCVSLLVVCYMYSQKKGGFEGTFCLFQLDFFLSFLHFLRGSSGVQNKGVVVCKSVSCRARETDEFNLVLIV